MFRKIKELVDFGRAILGTPPCVFTGAHEHEVIASIPASTYVMAWFEFGKPRARAQLKVCRHCRLTYYAETP